ncbi:hypothetical protein [Luteolibacter marinus]|uniref:hypothetical protein n=1 Tax=Luteolibacter marinus TaxID=2776705 RepID=UPI0018682C11|nr:hypothetical protein [Luteolibacter marinus]
MKPLLTIALLPLLAASTLRVAAKDAEAFLIYEEGDIERVWLTAATTTAVRYKETERAVDTKDIRISEVQSIYIVEPPEMTAAVELFQARKYSEAKEQLAKVKADYVGIEELADNPSTAAGYLELECLRKLGDLDGLNKSLEKFRKEGLTREYQLRQIELYAMWDAVRTKDWSRLQSICEERLKERMPGSQRAQVGYCLGLALDAQDKIFPAINAYNIAMTADTGASEVITSQAALNAMALYKKDPELQTAVKLWGTKDERPNSTGQQHLYEAASLAELFQLSLGNGKPLPKEHQDLLKYVKKIDVDK